MQKVLDKHILLCYIMSIKIKRGVKMLDDKIMNKINVQLYGGKGLFGGKETPLEADIIYCDTADKCSLYKEGKCLNCRAPFGTKCGKGTVTTIRGYTSKARKYGEFRSTYKNDETYDKLNYPNNYVALIDDMLYLNLTYTSVRKPIQNDDYRPNKWGYIISDGGIFGSKAFFVNINEINVDFLSEILSYKPRALMGGVILDYQEKIVPNIVNELKTVVPTLYKELIDKYPQFNKEPNYVGRYAYMKTLVDGSVLIDCHGNRAVKNGDTLYCESFTKGFVPFDGEVAECTIKIKDKQKYKVTNNSQCDENTIFD